jgi:O-antigen/teichoic acid export membrane protein
VTAPDAPAVSEAAPEAADALRDRALRGVMTMGLRAVIVRAIGLAGTLVLARLLGPSDFGIIALGLTIVVLGRFLSDGGVAPGLIRREQPPRRAELEAVAGLQLGVCVAMLAGVGVISHLVAAHESAALTLTLMAAAGLLDAARTPTSITLERELDFRLVVRAEVLEIAVYNAAAIALVAAGAGVAGVGVAAVLRAATGSAYLVRRGPVGLVRPRAAWSELRPLMRFGLLFQGAWLLTLARDEGLNLLLVGIAGTAALGAWALARRLLVVLTLLVESAWRVALPGMSRLLQRGEPPKRLLTRGLSLGAVACGLPVAAIVGTTPALVPALFGPGWGEAQRAAPWLAGGLMLAVPIGLVLNSLLWAREDGWRAFALGVPALVVTMAVAIPLMPAHGAVGAGIGWFAGGVTIVATGAWYARDLFGAQALVALLWPALATAAAIGAGWAVTAAIAAHWPAVLAGGAVASAVYLGALRVLDRDALARMLAFARRGLARAPA